MRNHVHVSRCRIGLANSLRLVTLLVLNRRSVNHSYVVESGVRWSYAQGWRDLG